MKRVVSIPPRLEEKVQAVLARNEYGSFDQFAIVALENQVNAELGESNPWETSATSNKLFLYESLKPSVQQVASNLEGSMISQPKSRCVTVDTPNVGLYGGPLWGQYYKFLPAKLSLRILANATRSYLVDYNRFRGLVAHEVLNLIDSLKKKDRELGHKFGEELTTGFPDKSEKSLSRFLEQYAVYYRSSGAKINGLPATMKWLSVVEQSGPRVGLTSFGYDFARLANPVLDHTGDRALSFEERDLILKHISQNLPAEEQHILFVLERIGAGVSSRNGLNEELSRYYAKNLSEARTWTPEAVNTMRSGVISRLFELGLIEKERDRQMVTYRISKEGKSVLEKLHSAEQIRSA